jgi:sodium/pantothenate symporter
MNLNVITFISLICLFLFSIWTVWKNKGKTNSIQDYAIGSITFSPVFVGLSLAASMTSAATFIINPGLIATYGWAAFVSYGLVLPIAALISLYILTKGFRKYGKINKSLTMAQWMGQRFNSNIFTWYFAFLSLLLITFVVLICVGITHILSNALQVSTLVVLSGLIIIVFGYMMFGGANTMVKTNAFQAVLMLIVALILILSKFNLFLQASPEDIFTKLYLIDTNLVKWTNPESAIFRDFFEIYICQVVIGMAIVCQPHIITKSLLLKDEKSVNTYLIAGITAQSIFFLVVVSGLYARISFPDLIVNGIKLKTDEIMSAYVVNQFHPIISLLLVLGLLAAGLSTLEGLIQSLSSSMTADIWKKIPFFYNTSDSNLIKFSILLLAIISFLFSWQQLITPNLSVAIFAQNGVYAYFSAAVIPVLMGIFLKDSLFWAPLLSSISAIVVHFSVYYLRISDYMTDAVRNPAISATLGILVGVCVGLAVYMWEKSKKSNKTI